LNKLQKEIQKQEKQLGDLKYEVDQEKQKHERLLNETMWMQKG